MSMPRPKGRKPSKGRNRITKLLVRNESGQEREVTDPAEIVRLLRADGFTVDDETGAIGLGPKLRPQ